MLHDTKLEMAALWHMNPVLGKLAEKAMAHQLEEDDFYDVNNKKLFTMFKSCVVNNGEMNAYEVNEEFRKEFPQHESYIWMEWLADAPYEGAPYQIIEKLRVLRARREAKEFKIAGDNHESYPSQLLDKSRELTDIISPHKLTREEMVKKIMTGIPTTPTGFTNVDRLLGGGIEDGGMMVLCAHPGTGKTTFAVNVAKNVLEQGKSVFFCTLEMPEERILTRLFQCMNGKTVDYVKKHAHDMNDVCGPIHIQSSGNDIDRILAEMTTNLDCDMFIIDYFTLISSKERASKIEKLEDICHKIKNFCFEHKKPLILIAQPNRELEKDKTNREPTLADLAWCSALAQDAHVVAFLWDKNAKEIRGESEQYADKVASFLQTGSENSPKKEKDLKIVIKKNRNGLTGSVDLDFNGSTMTFTEKTI